MPLDFVKSQKGKSLLIVDGYTFCLHRETRETFIWRCTDYHIRRCSARCRTTSKEVLGDILKKTSHNHAPDAAKLGAKRVVESIKVNARTTQQSTKTIIVNACSGVSTPVSAQLPSMKLISRTVQRTRVRADVPPPNPTSVAQMVVPDEYKNTERGQPFLRYNDNNFLIFATRQNLYFLKDYVEWFSDVTFKTVPAIFSQLYTIHGKRGNMVFSSSIYFDDRPKTGILPESTGRAEEPGARIAP